MCDRHRDRAPPSSTMKQIRLIALLLGLMTSGFACLSVHAARVRSYSLTVSWQMMRPDCFTRPVLAVNGAFPGPTLRVRVNETLSINLCNALPDFAITVHFHGLHQRQSPFHDGVSGVTQCALQPHSCQQIDIPVEQTGTYYYHAHHASMAADGLQGAIVVYDNTDSAGSEFSSYLGFPLLTAAAPPAASGSLSTELSWLLTDWFHDTSSRLQTGLDGVDDAFRWVGEPNAILLNGKGSYCADTLVGSNAWRTRPADCEGAPAALYNTDSQCGYPIVSVSCGSPVLVHVINSASLSYLRVAVAGHSMEIVGSDGLRVTSSPRLIRELELNSGERMDVLLTRDDASSCNPFYLVNITSMYRTNQPQLFGVLSYTDSPGVNSSAPQPSPSSFPMPLTPSQISFPTVVPTPTPASSPLNQIANAVVNTSSSNGASPPSPTLLPSPDVRLLLDTAQQRVHGQMRWTLNGVPHTIGPTPSYFLSLLNRTGASSLPLPTPSMSDIQLGSWVEVVIQNRVALNGVCEQHSWHLHGKYVHLIGAGSGTFRPGIDNHTFVRRGDLALLKDSFTVFPRLDPALAPASALHSFPYMGPPGSGCGWQAFLFPADNPGTWLLHCHILWHGSMGMGVVLHVRDSIRDRPLPALPPDTPLCGNTSLLYTPASLQSLLPHLATLMLDSALVTAAVPAAPHCAVSWAVPLVIVFLTFALAAVIIVKLTPKAKTDGADRASPRHAGSRFAGSPDHAIELLPTTSGYEHASDHEQEVAAGGRLSSA